MELLLKFTIETAVQTPATEPQDFERVIADSTVQEKAIAHVTDSRLLEIARHKVGSAAQRLGSKLKQTFAQEGKVLCCHAGGYDDAKGFGRLVKVLKRQHTTLAIVIREVRRKLADRFEPSGDNTGAADALTLTAMNTCLRAWRGRCHTGLRDQSLATMPPTPRWRLAEMDSAAQTNYDNSIPQGIAIYFFTYSIGTLEIP